MPERFVTVAQYEFLPEAETVRMHLEMEGFEAMLADANTVSTDWALGNAVGYIKLQVPESQANTAIPLVEEMRLRKLANAKSRLDDAETNRCLACGAEFPAADPACPACGWSYASDDVELDPEEFEEPDDTEEPHEEMASRAEEYQGWSDNLRGMKRPFVLVLLLPVAFVIVIGLLGLLMVLFQSLSRTV